MPVSGSPKTLSMPDEGRSSPATTFSSVDLPQPVGPTTETNSPAATASEVSFTAVYEPMPPRAANVQVILSNSTAAVTGPASERRVERRPRPLQRARALSPPRVHLYFA